MKTFALFLLLLPFAACCFGQVTICKEDGLKIETPTYTLEKSFVIYPGGQVYKIDVLYIKKVKNESPTYYVINDKTGKAYKFVLKVNFENLDTQSLAKLYAVKFYNCNTDPAMKSKQFQKLAQDSEFLKAYVKRVKEIKTANFFGGCIGGGFAGLGIATLIYAISNAAAVSSL